RGQIPTYEDTYVDFPVGLKKGRIISSKLKIAALELGYTMFVPLRRTSSIKAEFATHLPSIKRHRVKKPQ
ncbi:hypothetical protein CEXT_798371, partial [Caerostris extrusa]